MTPFFVVPPISPLAPGSGGADIDLWLGGPNADGRGLNAQNGGYAPASGLAIVSPSSSTPSSPARFLIRDAADVWRDKRAGDLACIGGRVWTGDDWSYFGAKNIEARGPLPMLVVPGITDTVRRYTTNVGRIVSDAPGGIIQPYSQRVDIIVDNDGSEWSVSPVEYWINTEYYDFFWWHAIVEYPSGPVWRPMMGIYHTNFVAGFTIYDVTTRAVLATMTNGEAGIRDLGVGPNGGRLIEMWGAVLASASYSTLYLFAYFLRVEGSATRRTCWIHNYYAVRLPRYYGRIYGFPSWCLVGAGAAPSLAAEEIAITTPSGRPITIQVRTDAATSLNIGYYDTFISASTYNHHFYALNSTYRWHPPALVFSGVDYRAPHTLTLRVAANDTVTGALDGVLSAASGTNTGSLTGTWYVGGRTQHRGLMPLRRVQLWSRHITDAEVISAHNAVVAAETK